MVNERMLELLLLKDLFNQYSIQDLESFGYDVVKLITRHDLLNGEFLNPYVIDNAEKSE